LAGNVVLEVRKHLGIIQATASISSTVSRPDMSRRRLGWSPGAARRRKPSPLRTAMPYRGGRCNRDIRAGPVCLNNFPRTIRGFLPGSLQNAVFPATQEGRSPTGDTGNTAAENSCHRRHVFRLPSPITRQNLRRDDRNTYPLLGVSMSKLFDGKPRQTDHAM
jgi:hypothetical protein